MKLLLLVNLGSPAKPEPESVGEYLKEFLMDPYVIDIPHWRRWLLVRGIIVPFRKYKSARAYAKIWTERGSPLIFHTQDLVREIQGLIGGDWRVDWAMRYGPHGLKRKLKEIRSADFEEIVVLPLYPQEAKSSSGTVVNELREHVAAAGGKWKVIGAFFDQPQFIDAWAAQMKRHWRPAPGDHVVFSFHGLPNSHVTETDRTGAHCLKRENCCAEITQVNRGCYRAQCFATARAIAAKLDLAPEKWSVAFQSGLGKRWIGPGLNDVLERLSRIHKGRVIVSCPSFVADCLETVEEVGIRTKAQAKVLGLDLELIPAVNASPEWAAALAEAVSCRHWPVRDLEPHQT